MTNETIAKEVAEKIVDAVYAAGRERRLRETPEGTRQRGPYDTSERECAIGRVSAILEALARSQSSEWIPVETRLPKKYVDVWVACKVVDGPNTVSYGHINRDGDWAMNSSEGEYFVGDIGYEVEAWMPMLLPSAPKEKANG